MEPTDQSDSKRDIEQVIDLENQDIIYKNEKPSVSESPEKVTVYQIGFKPQPTSVSASRSVSQEASGAGKNVYVPVKSMVETQIQKIAPHPTEKLPSPVEVSKESQNEKNSSLRQEPAGSSVEQKSFPQETEQVLSPIRHSNADEDVNRGSDRQDHIMSPVEQSFVAEAEQLVRTVSQNSRSSKEQSMANQAEIVKKSVSKVSSDRQGGVMSPAEQSFEAEAEQLMRNVSQTSRSLKDQSIASKDQKVKKSISKVSSDRQGGVISPAEQSFEAEAEQLMRNVSQTSRSLKDQSIASKDQKIKKSISKVSKRDLEPDEEPDAEGLRKSEKQIITEQPPVIFAANNTEAVLGPRANIEVRSPKEESKEKSKEKDRSPELSLLKEGKEVKAGENEDKKTGSEKISEMSGISVKQKFEVLNGVGAWKVQHRTYIHDYSDSTGEGEEPTRKMFQCNENSDFCARQCLNNYCRPLHVVVKTCRDSEGPDEYQPFLSINRECTCTCMWFNRPEIAVRWIENGNNLYLGRIRDTFTFGDIRLCVYDSHDALKYVIDANCCQFGLMCNCYCKSCETVKFLVKPVGPGRITELTKKSCQNSKIPFPNNSRFTVEFTENDTWEDKALLLSAVLFLESRYFEGDP